MILLVTSHGYDHISLTMDADLETDTSGFTVIYAALGLYRRYSYPSLAEAHAVYNQLRADWEAALQRA